MRIAIVVALCSFVFSCSLFAQDFNDDHAPTVTVTHADGAAMLRRHLSGLELLDGDPIYLRLPSTLSSAKAKIGDTVVFEVEQEIKRGGFVVVAQGAPARATVTDLHRRGRMLKDGRIDVRVDSIELVNGDDVPLRALAKARGAHAGDVGTAAALTPVDPVDAAVVWPAMPFLHGDEVEIPEGTKVIAFINGDHQLDATAFNLPLVFFHSQPAGAEVFVDNIRIGTTPITRVLSAGEHSILISADGFQPWRRTLSLLGGTVNVAAQLQVSK